MTYIASRCPCGHRACADWHVDGIAAVQGVHFTEVQARAVAALLNAAEDPTFGSAISFIIAEAFQPVYGPNGNENNAWKHYFECKSCLGNDYFRSGVGSKRSREKVIHTETCGVGKAIAHLRAIAREF